MTSLSSLSYKATSISFALLHYLAPNSLRGFLVSYDCIFLWSANLIYVFRSDVGQLFYELKRWFLKSFDGPNRSQQSSTYLFNAFFALSPKKSIKSLNS